MGMIGFGRAFGSFYLALIYQDMGLTAAALELNQQGATFLESMARIPATKLFVQTVMPTYRHLWQQNIEAAQMVIQELAFDPVELLSVNNLFGLITTLTCEVAFAAADYQRVIHLADEIIAVIEPAGKHLGLPDLLYFKGQALFALGNTVAAQRVLRQGQTIAETQGARRIGWQILATLAGIEEQLGYNLIFARTEAVSIQL